MSHHEILITSQRIELRKFGSELDTNLIDEIYFLQFSTWSDSFSAPGRKVSHSLISISEILEFRIKFQILDPN